MNDDIAASINKLWQKLGLQELRERLKEVVSSAEGFEQALKALPACDKCARLILLDQIERTGRKLGSEVISLTAMAETLKSVGQAAEDAQTKLSQGIPGPCQCREEECVCSHQ